MDVRGAHLRASLLDRLVDTNPDVRYEDVSLRTQRAPSLRDSVQRDLADLLNTRRGIPANGVDAYGRMVHHYGVPDLIHLNPRSESDRLHMAATLKDAIETWEPRLEQVQVVVHASDEAAPRLLQAMQSGSAAQPDQPSGAAREHLRTLLPSESVVVRVRGLLRVNGLQEPVSFPFVVSR